MNQPSAFQIEHPLSPRKFWKKMIEKSIISVIYTVFLEFIIFVAFLGIYINPSVESNTQSTLPVSFWVGLVIITFFVLYFLFNFIYSIYVKAYIKRYYYDCGDQFITIKKGVFAPTEIHVQYQKIQDVYVDQDILDRILGIYDVHIASATINSGIEAHIDGVSAETAEKIKNILLSKINKSGQTTTTETAQPVIEQPTAPTASVHMSQKVSSETYPVSGKWIFSALWSSIAATLGASLFFIVIFSGIKDGVYKDLNPMYLFYGFIAIFVYQIIYYVVWKNNYYFELAPDYIILRTGFIGRQENHLPYKSIQNIINTQGIIDRILGIATVGIENASLNVVSTGKNGSVMANNGISIIWQPKEKAEEINRILNDIVMKVNAQDRKNMGV